MPFYNGLRMKKTAAVLFIILIFFSGCKKESISGKSFRFPLDAEPRQLDPQVSTDSASVTVIAALFEGLARPDQAGNPLPAAATWTLSDDRLTYTFTLVDSKWSDGSRVTAHDFVFGMQRAVLPSTRSSLAEQLFDIKNASKVNDGSLDVSKLGVKALNDNQLTITLTKPNAEFPIKTASTPFMPCKQSFFESTGGRYGLQAEYTLTNGPFILKTWEHNKSILLNKHEEYHDKKNILPAAVRYMIGDVENPVDLLSKGLLDAAPIPYEMLEQAKQAGHSLVKLQDTVSMLWLNNDNAALGRTKIRQALRDSLEWDIIYKRLDPNIDTPATGFISPDAMTPSGELYRTKANAKKPTPRGKKAAAELAAGLKQVGLEKMPVLTLLCSDDDYHVNVSRYIVQSWQKNLSLYFKIETVSESELATRVKVGNYQIALYQSTATGAGALHALKNYRTGSVGNYAHFSDKSYDTKLSKASGTVTRSQLEELEAILWQTCPSIPLSFECRFAGIPKTDSGIIVRPFDGGIFGAPYDFRNAGKTEK
ncbi:MAG: peptide ABC transporter substrate-binding protein [Oscillospiraceae bacterium]|nr:peptide ABC transporter substrate-binding protein [Oscillospiraceae bacterium]MDD4414517.1 peptide ABC transporter substrate-binding protein [Oscillospiraceae bacterium]